MNLKGVQESAYCSSRSFFRNFEPVDTGMLYFLRGLGKHRNTYREQLCAKYHMNSKDSAAF